MTISIMQVKGIGPATAKKLAAAGIATADDLAAITPEQLAAVPGFRMLRAKMIIAQARQLSAETPSDADDDQLDQDLSDSTVAGKSKASKLSNRKVEGKVKKEKTKKGKTKKDKKKKSKKNKQKKSKSDKKKSKK